MNFGGDKLWPAPQSRWNWPPNPVLDAGPHKVSVVDGRHILVSGLASDSDGIQFRRVIALSPKGTEVRFLNTMTNVNYDKDVSWSIWEVAQVDDPDVTLMARNPDRFKGGYHVFKGSEPAPPQIDATGRVIRFRRGKATGAKIGGAPAVGWIASEKNGVRFRVSSHYPLNGEYPDNGCSHEIWSNPDPLKYMELELLSPIVTLKPRQTFTFETNWRLEKLTR